MSHPSWLPRVSSGGYTARKRFGWLIVILLIILLTSQACRFLPELESRPTESHATPLVPANNPLAPPEPADQVAAMLPGFPPIPQDLTHYIMRVDMDYAGRAFILDSRVEYTNTEGVSLDRLYFRLYPNLGQSFGDGMISILTTLVNGQAVEAKMSLLNSIVEVPLTQSLQPGAHVRIDFEITGKVPIDFGAGDLNTGYGMYNYSQGVFALADFYPLLAVYSSGGWQLDQVYAFGDSVYSDAALYTVEVLTDPKMVLATSGIEESQSVVGNKVLHRYVSGPARDFSIVASPNYQVTSHKQDGTTVTSYYLPGHAEAGAQALDTAVRALEIYGSVYGPYPYREYNIVEAPLNRPSGIEYPAMGLIASRLYSERTFPDFDTTVAHEVAHQWWYNVVGNDVIHAPWMDEALATYSSVYYWEQTGGQAARQQALADYMDRYHQNSQDGWDAPVTESMAFFQEHQRIQSYSPVVYAKGAMFYDELRKTIGDGAFFSALKFYYATHWFSVASSAELLSAFQTTTEVNLDTFFQSWLYSPEVGAPPTTTPTPTFTFTPTAIPEPTATPTPEPTPTPTPSPLVFAAIGDYGGGDRGAEAVANLIKSWQPEFIITLGDNNYPVGARDHIDQAIGQFFHDYIYPYSGSYGAGADKIRYFPVIGNHDMQSENGSPYYDYFSLPGNERYYDFVWGPVHFFALDSLDSEPDGVGASSAQAAWLQQALASSSSAWNLVYMHYPPYSSGLHGSTDWMRWPFGEWGADAVLSGHDHIYERLYIDGVTYFVNGMGGYDLYEFRNILDGSQMRYMDDFGAMRIEATDNSILFQFINLSNELIDSYEIRK